MADEVICESVEESLEKSNNNTCRTVIQDGDMKLDRHTLLAVFQFLKRNNLKETENILKKEANITDDDIKSEEDNAQIKTEMPSIITFYKCDENPVVYQEQYLILKRFIETSLDMHKCELTCVLYPLFVYVYLKLICNCCGEQAVKFCEQYSCDHDECYKDELRQLSVVTKVEHMNGNQLCDNLRNNKFIIRMSRDSYSYLKRFLNEKNMTAMLTIMQEHLTIDVYEGIPRTKLQINMTGGAMFGDVLKEANKAKVFHGLLKEPELNVVLDEDDEDTAVLEDGRPSKKRKTKKDSQLLKKSKADPNAPTVTRIPLPELKDSDKLEKAKAIRDISKKVNIGQDAQPSVLFYTFVNTLNSLTSIDICEDASMMSAGFSDSLIRIWPLNSSKLSRIKSPDELSIIDKERDDVMEQIIDEQSAAESRMLFGHSGPVYATSFSPDKNHMVSSSEDGTVRLWSLYTWTNLVCYKGHMYPVWTVKYGPHGHYFVSAGFDRTARLWSTDHYQPLRVFAGHLADVECVDFHPNSNYIVTGSADRTVRLWDVLNGNCVRVMTGHKASISAISFSHDGRYLASAGYDSQILLWDLATGELISQLLGHCDVVHSLTFSREGSVLASGGNDNTVKLWDMTKVMMNDNAEGMSLDSQKEGRNLLIATYATKATAVQCVHFNRRNILLAAGSFISM